jgi:hypothetical protein
MENRGFRHEDRFESVLGQHVAATQQTANDGATGENSLKGEELRLLVEFFQLLDRWDREVAQ